MVRGVEKSLNLMYCREVVVFAMGQIQHIAGSSNGRTTASGAVYLGSNPGPAANKSALETRQFCVFY